MLAALALVLALTGCQAPTPEEQALELHGRATLALDGAWQAWLDPGATGLRDGWAADLAAGRSPAGAGAPLPLTVPGPLEAGAATRDYDGVVFCVRDFRAPSRLAGCRLRLHFAQVNYACRAWLDGEPIGEHEGGYDAFELDVTGRLERGGSHRLVVMVIDPGSTPVFGLTLKTTPHAKESWYENTGGPLGPVTLLCDRGPVAAALAVRADPATSTIAVRATLLAPPAPADADPAGPPGSSHVVVSVFAPATDAAEPTDATDAADAADATDGKSGEPAGAPLPIARRELDLPLAAGGRAELSLDLALPGCRRWSPETPELYRLVLEADGRALGERRVGFRSLEIAGGNLLLNGERRVLKGVLWQPHFTGTGGVTPSDSELEQEVREILATGFNLVRAHVRPAPPAFLDAADRLGLLVLEEPAIGWVDDDPALLPRLQHEIDWMVERDAHHPSIILWGVLNELSGQAYRYAGQLTERLAALDGSRPVLEDSGGFIGDGRYVPPATASTAPPGEARSGPRPEQAMIDRHLYPPWPLPLASRDELADVGGEGQLVFVSEYGYGTLPDTPLAAAGFRERGILDAERVRFESMAATARRSAASGETWRTTSWTPEAQASQADAAEDMTEALRSNPALDLLCYTQWRGVSSECSAGLLEPWGQSRPARERLRHALRPLLAVVLPERSSVFTGEPVRCRVALVNDTGVPVHARALLHWSVQGEASSTGDLALGADDALDIPPGVTRRDVVLPPPAAAAAGTLELSARLLRDEHVIEQSTVRTLAVLAPPEQLESGWIGVPAGFAAGARAVAWPPIWAPPGESAARDFLRRRGQGSPPGSPGSAVVALIGHPERLDSELPIGEQLALWSMVRRGGAAIVLLPDPADEELVRRLGQRGGMRTLTALPLPAGVGGAPGNFMGRLQLFRGWPSGAPPRVLGRDDAAFSPLAMLLGELPAGGQESAITLGPLGNRLGTALVELPYGRGTVTLVGWPLLDPVDGAIDAQRETLLAERLRAAVAAARERLGAVPAVAPPDWPAGQLAELARAVEISDQLIALGDRSAPFVAPGLVAQGRLPDKVAALPAARAAALTELLDGQPARARERLLAALGPLWTEETQRVVALEAEVLERLGARVAAAGRDNWDAAYDAVKQWALGVAAWFAGDSERALDWLGRAQQTLQLGPEAPAGNPGA